MHLKTEVASVVGPSDETHWGQAILSPTAYGVVELEGTNSQRAGIELLSELTERLREPPVSLRELTDLAQGAARASAQTILLLVPVGAVIYISLVGAGAVYLKRGANVSTLLTTQGSISGTLQEGDTVLLASKSLTQSLTGEVLLRMFDHLSAKEAAEKLTLAIHEGAEKLGSAALIFHVDRFIHTEEESETVHSPREIVQIRPMETIWSRPKALFRSIRRSFPTATRPRKVSIVTIILLVLFLTSVALGVAKRASVSSNKEVETALLEATHAFEEGGALLDLNPVKGRERLTEAKKILEPLTLSLSPNSSDGKKVKELYIKVTDKLTVSMHVVHGESTLFFDPSLLKKNGKASSMSLFEDTLGLLDTANRAVYTLTVSGRSSAIVGGGDAIGSGHLIAIYGDKLYVLTDSGIIAIRLSDKKTSSVIPKSEGWGTISSLVSYGGNLYLLDTAKQRIWKYVATETGFSELREYLNPDTLPDFSLATGMAIDGSVWIGTTDGKILRFTQGKENTFLPEGVEPAFGKHLSVFTSDSVKNIYVLDSDNKRVVVIDKDGAYMSQYVWEGNIVPTQMVVSEKEKKILLLMDGKIYNLEIK